MISAAAHRLVPFKLCYSRFMFAFRAIAALAGKGVRPTRVVVAYVIKCDGGS